MQFFTVAVCLLCCEISYGLNAPKAFTKYGPVNGIIQISRNGREYLSFRGIPYAKPPLGPLRFSAPQKPDRWIDPINCTKDAHFCIRKDYYYQAEPRVEGSEDCLYLNVYTPKSEKIQYLPVMVYIHGGGFIAGEGTSDVIGPDYIMDQDVVMVTFNYRVGFFGFFSTLDDAAPGNTGLKDQTMALRFVRENIKYFGGDRKRVTIFGQSAGGSSVSYHLISPLSRGLFHRAISQSGVSLNIYAKPMNAVQKIFTPALALFTGCSLYMSNNYNLVNCLRKVDAAFLTNVIRKFKYFSDEPIAPHFAVIEKQTVANPRPFFPRDPLEYLQAGRFMKVPWMVGVTQDEGIFRVAPLTRQPEVLRELNSDFHTLLPLMLGLPLSNGDNTEQLFRKIVDFYLDGNYFIDVNNSRSVQGFIDLYSDRTMNYGTYQNIMVQSRNGHRSIWVYNFNYRGQYTYGDRFACTTKDINFKWGVCHNDELIYLFRIPSRFSLLKQSTDLRMSAELIKIWTNFATYGDPDPFRVLGWNSLNFTDPSEVKNSNINVMHIIGNSKNDTISYRTQYGFYPERMHFWARQRLLENFPGLI